VARLREDEIKGKKGKDYFRRYKPAGEEWRKRRKGEKGEEIIGGIVIQRRAEKMGKKVTSRIIWYINLGKKTGKRWRRKKRFGAET